MRDRGGLARPVVLPPAPAKVERAGEEAVEAFEERWEMTLRIVHDGMEVIRYGAPRDEVDGVASGSLREYAKTALVFLSGRTLVTRNTVGKKDERRRREPAATRVKPVDGPLD